MTKEVLFGKQSRDRILSGVKKIVKAVACTMGANGKCVLVGDAFYGADGMLAQRPTIVSKDGWTVTKHFSLQDPVEHRGAMMIKEAATKTVDQAGDATTATCVLAGALIEGGVELIDAGVNSQKIKKAFDKSLEYAIDGLKKISIPVRGNSDRIRQIATISANNDKEIGDLIADVYSVIGDDGVIDIEASQTGKTEVKTFDGYRFDNRGAIKGEGWVSPLFINKPAKETCEFEDPYILLYDKRITHHDQFSKILSQIPKGVPILIICEDSEGEGLAVLVANKMQGNLNICVAKSPEFGQLRTDSMEDIALLTGATFVTDSKGVGIMTMNLSHLGRAKKTIVNNKETVIIGGGGDTAKLQKFVEDLRATITDEKTEEEKHFIEKRIARLTGGFAVIQVGAATETELSEKLDRVDDAVRATKAAIAEGAVPGGGAAFLNIEFYRYMRSHVNGDQDFAKGMELFNIILSSPFLQICENSGVEGKKIMSELCKGTNIGKGYNALTGEIVDMVDAGIIDSTKALRCALTNAVSVAGMVLTSECSITTIN